MSNRIFDTLNGSRRFPTINTSNQFRPNNNYGGGNNGNVAAIENLFKEYTGANTMKGRYDINNDSIAEKILISKGVVRDPGVARLIDRSKHMIHDVYLHSNTSGPTRSVAFFVRSNLNLFKAGPSVNVSLDSMLSRLTTQNGGDWMNNVGLNPDLANYPTLLSAVTLNAELALELCRDACGGSGLMPLLANHCTEIAPLNIQSDDRDGVRNMYGKSMQLPGVFNYYDNQISVTFNDNRYGDVSKLFYLMGVYKDHVVREGFKRDSKYIARNAIDWATSIYVMTMDQDNYIIGWVKYTGCVPKTLPLNLAQHKREGFSEGELTGDIVIDFQVFKTNPYKISTLAEFNKISGFDIDRVLPLRCKIDKDPIPVTVGLSELMRDGTVKNKNRARRAAIVDMPRSRFEQATKNRNYKIGRAHV